MKTSNKKPDPTHQRSLLNGTNAEGRKWLFILIGVGVTASLTTLVIVYFFITAGLNKAQDNLHACKNLLNSDNFFEAEQECEQAKEFLSTVKLVGQGKKEQLNREVHELLSSQKLQQGLLGNIMVDGKFVSQPTKNLILAFKKAKTNGDLFFEQGNWPEAETNYQRAMGVAAKTAEIDQFLLADARKQLSRTQFNIFMQNGDKALVVSDWQGALTHFNEALLLAKKDSNILPEDMLELTLLINRTEFDSLLKQGDELFNQDDWNAALISYEKALKIGYKLHPSQSDPITGLLEAIARTKLYITINKGQKAFTDTKWDDAISQYKKAIDLLMENSKILSENDTKESSEKLSRILLQTTIVRDTQEIAKYLKSEEYDAAMGKLRAIQKAIVDSPAGDLPEFQTVMQDTSNQLAETNDKLLVSQSIDYLTQNYQRLFLKHYPETILPELNAPKIEYLKKIGNSLLFRMQCTEDNRGRPLRLQIKYLYSPDTDTWELYSEE